MKLGSGEWVTPTIQLLRLVDEGAMGSVWIADHVSLGAEVAVKFVAERYAQNAKALRRLEAEARSCAQLKSPHIVKIFDYGVHEGERPYFVMEYLEGESLRDRFERGDELSLRETALLVTHVARGLHSAHRMGIVHRDIKPANLFLLEDDSEFFVKILDFGVAKGLTKGVTEPGLLLGTPLYMSREAIVDHHVDHRLDLWALSVVAYEALTGEMPFDGETLDEVCAAIWRGKLEPPSVLNPDLTPEIDAWFERAFHRERQERPASAKQLAASFVSALSTVPGALAAEDADPDWRVSQLDLIPYAGAIRSSPSSTRPLAFTPPPPSSEPPPDSIPDSLDSGELDADVSSPADALLAPRPGTTSGITLVPPPNRRRLTITLGVAATAAIVASAAFFTGENGAMRGQAAPFRVEAQTVTAKHVPLAAPSSSESASPAASTSAPAVEPVPKRAPKLLEPPKPNPKKGAPEKDLGF